MEHDCKRSEQGEAQAQLGNSSGVISAATRLCSPGRGLRPKPRPHPTPDQTTAASGGHTLVMCDKPSEGGHPPHPQWQ